MQTDDEECVDVDVTLPITLLREIDHFAVHNGYEDMSAVVSDAIGRSTDSSSEP